MTARPTAVLLLVVVLVISACSSDNSDGTQTGPSSSEQPSSTDATNPASTSTTTSPPKAEGSSGCGQAPDPGPSSEGSGDVEQTITSSGAERTYRLEIPEDYEPDTPVPLIFNLHGAGSNAIQQSVYSSLPKVAREKGIIVVTPDARGGLWSPALPGRESPDIVFVEDLLADIDRRYCVDQNRVHAAGLSLGSAMSASVVCALPEIFASAGMVALNEKPEPCEPVPVVVFHGTKDNVVPYGPVDESGADQSGTLKNLKEWATLDGCSTEPEVKEIGADVEQRTYPGCKGGTEVELYTVVDGGHTWPGSDIEIGPTTQTIDATEIILDFFAEHPKSD